VNNHIVSFLQANSVLSVTVEVGWTRFCDDLPPTLEDFENFYIVLRYFVLLGYV